MTRRALKRTLPLLEPGTVAALLHLYVAVRVRSGRTTGRDARACTGRNRLIVVWRKEDAVPELHEMATALEPTVQTTTGVLALMELVVMRMVLPMVVRVVVVRVVVVLSVAASVVHVMAAARAVTQIAMAVVDVTAPTLIVGVGKIVVVTSATTVVFVAKPHAVPERGL